MQLDMRPLCFAAPDVEIAPPVRVGCEEVAGVFVQAVVEFVAEEVQD